MDATSHGGIAARASLRNTVTCKGFAWLLIMVSESDDWIYWPFFTITVNYNSSHIALLLNDVSLPNLCEESRNDLWLTRMNQWTPFYNCERTEYKSPPSRAPLLFFMNPLSRKSCVNSKQRSGFLSVYNFQFPYPWKPCFIISWFAGINLSVATFLPIRFLETPLLSQYECILITCGLIFRL
jgi:hypothetical protein